MALGSRRSPQSESIWPGYVDVLSALLMVVIFVLLIFTFSQFILSHILTSQSSELEDLHLQLEEITKRLGLEQETNAAMTETIAALSAQVDTLTIQRTELQEQVEYLQEKRIEDREIMEEDLRAMASLQEDIQALETLRRELEERIGELAATLENEQQLSETLRDRSKALRARLAEEKEKTLLVQEEIEQRDIRIQALSALVGEQREALENQRSLAADARAEVALLNRKMDQLRQQLDEIANALRLSELKRAEQEEEIRDIGERLNIELARRVTDLERYRSEFFGRLRDIIADNPMISIEGDRFLLQAELLFPSGSAELSEQGKNELEELAEVLRGVLPAIPDDLQWILRVDGHTDRIPITTANFSSNWELSAARALSVVQYLAGQGIPENRMAAAGFSKFHPVDPADTPEAHRRNRRIEIKFTSR
ncbi:peptidoglycan -binding protein [Desulfopila inferna]|uniref:peptidoglycan -binding protein n=1 Tax=Desulfopila inferna TaxID=468528 RepID=UPI0019658125|nr:peptidoglycan -binding protein [Desulfopila inferna]MBM9603295.1 peptidoglycan -binding protein [Desulfopila inferna]